MKPLLSLRAVETYYGNLHVHRGIDLDVDEGELVCLLGGNASGKSTAMKVILGLHAPVAGDIFWEGRSIRNLATPERIRLGLSSVPEARRIFPAMSVEENILMGAYLRKDASGVKRDKERVLELFPRLRERPRQAGGSLSGGEQQMLAMARALMSNPRLICMDEPTMGLSPRYVEKILETIEALNKEGLAVLMVEQNAIQALSVANRGYVLMDGRMALSGEAHGLLADPRVREAYLGG
ncbi:MAG TPA: ABC transporter ATP-binding protein [Rectinemataceae bacterium]|nr:ABC transporter ATP-binding protein [Rectinemataceae bacterium]